MTLWTAVATGCLFATAVAEQRPATVMGPPTTLGIVDEQPRVLSHPPIRYPPKLLAVGAEGTVLVQAQVDTSGHVVPGSATVVSSVNHAFDREALRAVLGTVYLRAWRHGTAVTVMIRQPVTFLAH